MSMTTTKGPIKSARLRLSARYKYIIMPIDPLILVEKLREVGFSLPARMPRPPAGTGFTYQPVGSIGQKGENSVELDLGKGIIGIEGAKSDEVIKDFQLTEKILSEEFSVDIENRTWFLVCIAEMTLPGHKSAIETARTQFAESKLFHEIGQIVGETPIQFGLRLASKSSQPLDENWLDFKIEPLVNDARSYYVSVVYRNANRSKVYNFLTGLEDKVEKVIQTVERSTSTSGSR